MDQPYDVILAAISSLPLLAQRCFLDRITINFRFSAVTSFLHRSPPLSFRVPLHHGTIDAARL